MLQFCSVSSSLSHTTFQIKWEVYFSKELCRSSSLRLYCFVCYDFACIYICVCIVGHGGDYATQVFLFLFLSFLFFFFSCFFFFFFSCQSYMVFMHSYPMWKSFKQICLIHNWDSNEHSSVHTLQISWNEASPSNAVYHVWVWIVEFLNHLKKNKYLSHMLLVFGNTYDTQQLNLLTIDLAERSCVPSRDPCVYPDYFC